MEPIMENHRNGRLVTLHTNIRLGRKRMGEANTLAYYDMTTITALKRFIVMFPELANKYFTTELCQGSSKKGRTVNTIKLALCDVTELISVNNC
jgi:hypothetical protein